MSLSQRIDSPALNQFTTVAGSKMIDEAKMGGITPAMFSFSGKCDDWPPYTLFPT
ncbi:hypothetical protein D3C71_2054470 [compost metagenome]